MKTCNFRRFFGFTAAHRPFAMSAAILLGALASLLSAPAHADIALKDDTGREIRLKAPAKRIVALAPQHLVDAVRAAVDAKYPAASGLTAVSYVCHASAGAGVCA